MNSFSARKLAGLILLLGLNASLLALAWWQYRQPLSLPTDSSAQHRAEDAADNLPEPDDYALDDYSETLDRPLFLPQRRPLEDAPKEAPKQATQAVDDTPDVVLVGVIITPDAREVLLRWRGASKLVRLALHQSIDGWEVDEIENDRVFLSKGGDTLSAELDRKRDRSALPQRKSARLSGQLYTTGTTR